MKADEKITFFLTLWLLMFLVPSCSVYREPAADTALADPDQTYDRDSLMKRFEEPDAEDLTAVEPAIELSKKYAELSDEAAGLKMKNQDLAAENRQLKDRADILEAELQQAQKELAQANNLLREMVVELNNWKTNVIGFRQEMRDSEKAQLEALLKILKVLGGEVKTESVEEGADSAGGTAGVSGRSQPEEHPSAGEPNE